nr:hypothetical protein [Trentepohlia sp. YN1317]
MDQNLFPIFNIPSYEMRSLGSPSKFLGFLYWPCSEAIFLCKQRNTMYFTCFCLAAAENFQFSAAAKQKQMKYVCRNFRIHFFELYCTYFFKVFGSAPMSRIVTNGVSRNHFIKIFDRCVFF